MARLAFLTALLLAGPALAGCIGSDDTTEGEPDAAPDIDGAMEDSMDAAASQASADVEPPEPIVTPVSQAISFTTGAWACEHTVLMQCEFLGLGTFESSFEPAFDGMLTGYELTLSWEAATPLMEQLRFGVYAYTEVDGEHQVVLDEYIEGASPLALTTSGRMLPEDVSIWIWTWTPCEGTDADHICPMTEQTVNVEGSVTSVVMDAASMADHSAHTA